MSLRDAPDTPTKPCRVVVVDDHPIILSGVRMLLENEAGFEWVGSAKSVKEAIESVARAQPDAVVLDLSLGGNDGIELVKQLRALAPASALLCYTMNDEALFAMKAMRAGAAGFLSKQEPLEELSKALRTVCTGEKVFSRNLQRALFGGVSVSQEAGGLDRLTDRELQVLRLIGLAKGNHEIAAELGLSVKTVSTHRESLKQKLNLRSSPELVRHAVLLVERKTFEK